MDVCERMRLLRISKALTRKEVAKKIGVSEQSVKCWENGTKHPSMAALIALASIFGVSTDFILGIDTKKEKELLMTKQESKLLTNYRKLDTYGRRLVDTVCAMEESRVEETKAIREAKKLSVFQEELSD